MLLKQPVFNCRMKSSSTQTSGMWWMLHCGLMVTTFSGVKLKQLLQIEMIRKQAVVTNRHTSITDSNDTHHSAPTSKRDSCIIIIFFAKKLWFIASFRFLCTQGTNDLDAVQFLWIEKLLNGISVSYSTNWKKKKNREKKIQDHYR